MSTVQNIEAMQTRTFDEIISDKLHEESDEDLSDIESDDEDVIYNPLKIPLGWDGKPIPFWLFKLHGLNIEYKCEICGDYSYFGPRAFERHFFEWRHVNKLKQLGIDNSKDFKDITKIEDALELAKKLVELKSVKTVIGPEDEEFEDEKGNVFSRRAMQYMQYQ